MKCQIIFMILAALIATSSCNTWDDLLEYKKASDTNFETLDDQDPNLWDSTDLSEYLRRAGPKNILSQIIQKVLDAIIPNLNNIRLPLLNFGPFGRLENILIDLDDGVVYPVEGSCALDVKNLTITFGRITLNGLYNRTFIFPGLEISQRGDFSVDLQDVRFTTGLTVQLVVDNFTIIDFPDFDLSVNKSVIQYENSAGSNTVGNLLDDILGYGLPQFIEESQGQFMENYGRDIANFLNPIINCMKDNIWNPLKCLNEIR